MTLLYANAACAKSNRPPFLPMQLHKRHMPGGPVKTVQLIIIIGGLINLYMMCSQFQVFSLFSCCCCFYFIALHRRR